MTDLDALALRIERVALDPDDVSAPFSRLLRPILSRLGVDPELRTAHLHRLVDRLRASENGAAVEARDLEGTLDAAKDELATNVSAVERACVVNEQPMVTQGAWLRRMYEILVRAERAVVEGDVSARAILASTPSVRLLPPLAVASKPHLDEHDAEASARRLVELELVTVDRIIDAADAESELLGRKRRLFEAARQTLLGASAAMPLDAEGTAGRLEHLAQQIARIDRLEAAGLSSDASLSHQLRQATTRGERERAYAALAAMHTVAIGQADERMLGLTSRALRTLDRNQRVSTGVSLARSAREMFGVDLQSVARATYATSWQASQADLSSKDPVKRDLAETAKSYFTAAGASSLTSAAVAVDGCFELGGAMVPTRVEEHETIVRAVRHPTPDLALLPAVDVIDLPDAIIEDPRTLVLDLAAGRLLARRYIAHEDVSRRKTVLRGEVRAYVLDGSGSMNGPRARMRDAIVATELLTLRRRLTQHAKLAHVVLFYRYFTEHVGPSTRVDRIDVADAALGDVLGSIHSGGTNIEAALVATIGDIAAARAKDPDLARAQIVVVTDGLAPVSEENVNAARESLRELPIALSVIALGEQNEALRAIVARQHARGERAFYHFIDDATLRRVAAGDVDPEGAIHPPPVASDRATPEALAEEIGALVEEIASRGHAREVDALEALDENADARREVGLVEGDASESELARARALYRDRGALQRQFDRWFPEPPKNAPGNAGKTGEKDADIDAVVVLLSTIAEMIGVVGGSELARMADAIDLLERLLPDARLTPARYQEVVASARDALAPSLSALRAAAGVHKSSSA